jgi:hypothetical protein
MFVLDTQLLIVLGILAIPVLFAVIITVVFMVVVQNKRRKS